MGFLLHEDAAVGILGTFEAIPECDHDLSHDHVVGVHRNETQDEYTVVSKVLVGERVEQFPIERFARDAIHDLQVFLQEVFTIEWEDLLPDAHEKPVGREDRNENKPEPDKYKNLFIEQIHRKHALERTEVDGCVRVSVRVCAYLYRMFMYMIGHGSNFEVTHCDARKSSRPAAFTTG